MGLGGCYTCIKYLMFAFNFLFWLLGCAILGVGIWIRLDQDFQKYIDEDFNLPYLGAYILIGVGVLMMIIGFVGCCGAIRNSQCLLAMFFIFLFLIFAVLLGAGIYVIISKSSVDDLVEDMLDNAVKNYRTNKASQELMDNVQLQFKCCGSALGISDYGTTSPHVKTCTLEYYQIPCKDKLTEHFTAYLTIIAGVAIGIAIVMILGMIFSLILCCSIRDVA
ncbi:CD81 protein-like [Argonauta hians]